MSKLCDAVLKLDFASQSMACNLSQTRPHSARFLPESEPYELVGQCLPTSGGTAAIAWSDGPATCACSNGFPLLVDNLGVADATVLERLNPLLETPPVWVITECGKTEPTVVHKGFRFMATFTPLRLYAGADVGTQGEELSPALANRMSAVHMLDVMDAVVDEQEVRAEMQQVCAVLTGGCDEIIIRLGVDVSMLL